jgi:late competence protein required for DNA uptake (superfamily II DNA/RNA helicase)
MQQFYENTQQHDQVLMSRLVTESATSTTTEEMLEQITKQETTTRIPTKEKFRKRPLVIPPVYARLPESKKNNKKKINKTKIESDMVENTVQMSSLSDLI